MPRPYEKEGAYKDEKVENGLTNVLYKVKIRKKGPQTSRPRDRPISFFRSTKIRNVKEQ